MTSSPREALVVAGDVRDDVLAHAREGAAEPSAEVCGVLAGRDGDPPRATESRRVRNVAADPRARYELDPAATVGTIDALEADGLDVLGFYHSHPESAPVPSETDLKQARWEGYVYLIAAPAADELRAYRYSDGEFRPLDIRDG